jgi:hypothetical protein
MFEIILLIVIGTSIWVFADAKSLGVRKGLVKGVFDMGPGEWAFACLLVWIICFPLYLSKRTEYVRLARERSASSHPNSTAATAPHLASPQDVEQQLRSLAKLRDDRLITDADFESKKKQILGI